MEWSDVLDGVSTERRCLLQQSIEELGLIRVVVTPVVALR